MAWSLAHHAQALQGLHLTPCAPSEFGSWVCESKVNRRTQGQVYFNVSGRVTSGFTSGVAPIARQSAQRAHCTLHLQRPRLAPHVVDAHDPFVRACPATVIADSLQNTGGTKPAPILSAGCLLQPALATSAAPVPHAAARRRSLVVVARRPARVAPSHARVATSHAVAPAARVWFGVDLPR